MDRGLVRTDLSVCPWRYHGQQEDLAERESAFPVSPCLPLSQASQVLVTVTLDVKYDVNRGLLD